MNIGTSIVIAFAWLYAGIARHAPNVTDTGIKLPVRRAWILTAIAIAYETIDKLAR